jgi:hypothetical protein
MAPPSYYVVCLHRPCSQEAAQFIADALTKSRVQGGADLIVHQVQDLNLMQQFVGQTVFLHLANYGQVFSVLEIFLAKNSNTVT